jgi:hypothetical protein
VGKGGEKKGNGDEKEKKKRVQGKQEENHDKIDRTRCANEEKGEWADERRAENRKAGIEGRSRK